MMTARYAGFLQRFLPPFWPTTDKEMVLGTEHPRPVAPPPPVADSARSAVTGGHAWTDEQDEELRDAADSGMLLHELVEHFELPEAAIAARADQLGLTLATGQLFD